MHKGRWPISLPDYIPILLYPIQIPKPHPPENYEYLVNDATIVATIADLAGKPLGYSRERSHPGQRSERR